MRDDQSAYDIDDAVDGQAHSNLKGRCIELFQAQGQDRFKLCVDELVKRGTKSSKDDARHHQQLAIGNFKLLNLTLVAVVFLTFCLLDFRVNRHIFFCLCVILILVLSALILIVSPSLLRAAEQDSRYESHYR